MLIIATPQRRRNGYSHLIGDIILIGTEASFKGCVAYSQATLPKRAHS